MTTDKSKIKKTTVKKKVSPPTEVGTKIVPVKQYTVFYTIGDEPNFFIASGTDYKLTTLDIKSPQTSEISSFPVVFVVDDVLDTLDIIPMSSIGNIRYNWGFRAEATKYATEVEALQKKMKENTEEESVGEPTTLPKKKKESMDVQYV